MTMPSHCRVPATFLLGAIVLVCPVAQGASVDYFADNGFGNPLATMQHPSAEHYKGTTYIAYQGPHEDAYVCAYNHAGRKWSGPVLAGVSLMGRTPDPVDSRDVDNHGKPAMMVDTIGYIHVVYGAHGGSVLLGKNALGTPGGLRGGKLTHLVSKDPENISSWKVLDNISPFGTYPQFVQMGDGDVYLFYRHGSHRSDWVYQKSADDCRTFSPPVSVLKHKVQIRDAAVHDSWYAWFARGHGDTISAVYVYHPCATPGHTKDRRNAYYMRMNCTDDSWENAAGETLTIPVTKEYADRMTIMFDTGAERCNHGTCRVDQKGHPHAFFRFDAGQVRYSRWTGRAWTGPIAVVPGGRSEDGDMIVDSPTDVRMILASSDGNAGEVGWWKTTDGGQTWVKEPPILSRSGGGFDIGALVENCIPEGMVVVSEDASPDHLYRKMLLLGKDGPVTRPEAEAAHVKDQLRLLEKSGAKPAS